MFVFTTTLQTARRQSTDAAERLPPHAYFLVSALFHYLGPAFAVLLFAHLPVLGVAWLRIAAAALVFAVWRRPWRFIGGWSWPQRCILLLLGVVLGAMNSVFYLAIARVPLGTVGAIEYLGTIVLAAIGARTGRNGLALGAAVVGVWCLTDVGLDGQALGFALAFANCALFVLYVMLGHQIAGDGGAAGIDRLGMAMLVALVTVTPFAIGGVAPAISEPKLLVAGLGVGFCSSVIPYVCDQLAMARIPRATFALLLALLPASASMVGFIVLRQVPTRLELAGVLLVIVAVAIHQPADPQP